MKKWRYFKPIIFVTVASVLLAILLAGCGAQSIRTESYVESKPRWWKGNTHTHTFWSDGQDYPEMVVDWYKQHGYNFLTLSDHNILSEGQKWADVKDVHIEAGMFDKYMERFGPGWVQTRQLDGKKQVRLKPLNEFRHLYEEPGRFMLVQGEELTPGKGHVNAINTIERIGAKDGSTDTEILQNNINAVLEQEKRTGQEMLPHVNHPNWRWDITAEDIFKLTGEKFFELYNEGGTSSNNYGDEKHTSMEKMWDIILAMRLGVLDLGVMYGIATDDTHTYHETGPNKANPGRGWVVVRSEYLTPEYIIKAMEAGEFYASTGVVLKDVRFDGKTLTIRINSEWGVSYTTEFVSTMKGFDSDSKPVYDNNGQEINATRIYSDEIGIVLKETKGSYAEYTLTGDELYVRARITSTKLKSNPHVIGELEAAWVQPVLPCSE